MFPQVSDVYNLARKHLGDTQVPGGQVFTDSLLPDYFGEAYRALVRVLERNSCKNLRNYGFFNVPAYVNAVTPAGMGMQNMGVPIEIYPRKINSTFVATVTNITGPSNNQLPYVILQTDSPHNMSNGDEFVTYGFDPTEISPEIMGEWNARVVDSTHIQIVGCAATGVNGKDPVADVATGTLSTGTTPFGSEPIRGDYDFGNVEKSTQSTEIKAWMWQAGYFRFLPANEANQLKIVFKQSGTAPSYGYIYIDDCLDALALFTAASAFSPKAKGQTQANLFMRAVGNPSGDTTQAIGGAFAELVQLGVQQIDYTIPVRQPPFRQKRTTSAPSGTYGSGGFF